MHLIYSVPILDYDSNLQYNINVSELGNKTNMLKKDIAISFLQMASSGAVREAYEKYIHPDFIHHNAYFKSDCEAILRGMEESAQQFPNKQCEILRTLEDDDLVAIHCKITFDSENVFSLIHIFRFEDEKIVEEWEASQEALQDSPNENGIF